MIIASDVRLDASCLLLLIDTMEAVVFVGILGQVDSITAIIEAVAKFEGIVEHITDHQLAKPRQETLNSISTCLESKLSRQLES